MVLKSRVLHRRATLRGLFALAATSVAPWPLSSRAARAGQSEARPFVFADRGSLERFLECDSPSASAARATLEWRCGTYLRGVAKYAQPFSGCNLAIYYRDLTDEYRGAADALSTLATYAYLVRIGQGRYGQEKVADEALKAAREILLPWARSGIREGGRFRGTLEQFCDDKGDNSLDTRFSIGLTFGRGVPSLVNAVDLLSALSVFSKEEAGDIDRFVSALGGLVADASNFRARRSNLDCNRFSNHVSIQLAALASIARLHDDKQALSAVVLGQRGGGEISWLQQVGTTIYGSGQHILNCFKPGESPDFSQTDTPQAGEVVDRFRARPEQTFGYPMFSLTYLLLTLKILDRTELRQVAPVADARARIASALDYYGPYFARYLAADEVRAPADFRYPGIEQYAGKLISRKNGATITGADGHLLPFLLAGSLLPRNPAVKAVISRANQFPPYKAFSAVASLYLSDICAAAL